MNIIFLLLFFVAGAGLTFLIVEFLIPRTILWLAEIDTWWSPFRNLPPPGEMYILVRGDPDGPFDHVIESVPGYKYNPDTHEFTSENISREEREEEVLEGVSKQEGYLAKIGATWVGFWRYFLWRKVSYDKWERLKKSEKWGLEEKDRGDKNNPNHSPSIFFRYNMATGIEEAEAIGNFPVDAIVVFTAQLTNPVKAFFFAGGWEVQTNAAVQGVVREYIGTQTIDDLRKEVARSKNVPGTTQVEEEKKGPTLVERIKALGGKAEAPDEEDDPRGLYYLFGVEIVDARFVQFDLVKGDPEMTRAVRIKEIKKQEALGVIEEAEGKKQARQIEADGIREDYAARSSVEGWETLEIADALRKTGLTALGGDIMTAIIPREKGKEK